MEREQLAGMSSAASRAPPYSAASRKEARIVVRRSSISTRFPSLDVPECPAVAGGKPLRERADLMDRTDRRAEGECAIDANEGGMASISVDEPLAGAHQSRLDHAGERDARLAAARRHRRDYLEGQRFDRVDSCAGDGGVVRIALDADVMSTQAAGDRAGRAGAEERVEHEIVGMRGGEKDP